MSDIETMRDMLRRAKIDFEEQPSSPAFAERAASAATLVVHDGYPCFFSCIDFREDGSLMRISAWE